MYVLSWPAIYALELTPLCNNQCPGCSNVYASDRGCPPMPAVTWERLLATFAPEAVAIRLTGGEPTLHPEFLRILQIATSFDAVVTIFTNGRWKHPGEIVKALHGWPRLSGLLISLHGARPASHEAFNGIPGSFAETIANIRLAVENNITVAISSVITRHNRHEIEDIVALSRQLGAHHVAFNRYIGPPLPEIELRIEEMEETVQTIEDLVKTGAPIEYGIGIPPCFAANSSEGCLAGAAYAAVDPWGRVRPCSHSTALIGSLHEESMFDLWHGKTMETWRSWMPPECETCAAYSTCHGGCRAVQELRDDRHDPLRGQPLSEYTRSTQARELPAQARPTAKLRMRKESFGYALLGRGHVLPVRADARQVVEACDGTRTFAQLATRFGQHGLNLLGDLWSSGMLDTA